MIAARLRVLLLACALAAPACAAQSSDDGNPALSDQDLTAWKASYASVADARVPKAFDVVTTSLGAVSPQTLPHEAKILRKQIGELRDYVDIFAFAYDKKGPGDPWVDLRKDLDVGYETVGAFKDLFDAQGLTLATKDPATGAWSEGVRPDQIRYSDTREVDKRRAKVLAWKTSFSAAVQGYKAYLSHADAEKMHEHDTREQSQFFWAGAGLAPDIRKGGLDNLSDLSRALLERGADDYASIVHLDEVTSTDDHEAFHDLRKRVRAIVKTVGYFPELLEPGATEPLAVASELVDRYGSLNDHITAYDLAKKSEKKDLAGAIESEWKALRKWQKNAHADEQLKELRKRIRKHG